MAPHPKDDPSGILCNIQACVNNTAAFTTESLNIVSAALRVGQRKTNTG